MPGDGIELPISILKMLWSRDPKGCWAIRDIKGIKLHPRRGWDSNFFPFESELELLTSRPSSNIVELMASFGPTDFLMKQSVVPVVAWIEGGSHVRCVGTASIISCTGYVLTAAHVLLDPYEGGYGAARTDGQFAFNEDLNFGVFIPIGPGYGVRGFRYFPFQKFWMWGEWDESPMLHEQARFKLLTDVAICKIPEMPEGAAHQPLGLSLNPFAPGESAYALGYAEMEDIPLSAGGSFSLPDFQMELFASIGEVMTVLPENHLLREVPTPGPCFDFRAKIPGRMSGAPIFGAEGAIIRGVVSRSFSGEAHAFGAMLGPAMQLPLNEPHISNRTLATVLQSGTEGMAKVVGPGL